MKCVDSAGPQSHRASLLLYPLFPSFSISLLKHTTLAPNALLGRQLMTIMRLSLSLVGQINRGGVCCAL